MIVDFENQQTCGDSWQHSEFHNDLLYTETQMEMQQYTHL